MWKIIFIKANHNNCFCLYIVKLKQTKFKIRQFIKKQRVHIVFITTYSCYINTCMNNEIKKTKIRNQIIAKDSKTTTFKNALPYIKKL